MAAVEEKPMSLSSTKMKVIRRALAIALVAMLCAGVGVDAATVFPLQGI
jgi:hypothetical protein